MTRWRRSRLSARALMIIVPSCAAALAASQALASPAEQPLHLSPRPLRVTYGRDVVLRGTAGASNAGHTAVLEFARRGQSEWRRLSSSTIGADGRFRLAGAPTETGAVRALDASTGSLAPFLARGSSGGATPASTAVPVDVAARLRMPARRISVLGGHAIRVRGRLVPGQAGRKVSLQGRQAGAWRTLATARTRASGHFALRYVTAAAGEQRIRVSFAGDRRNGHTAADAGRITVYRQAAASWYNDGATTACGFHAHYGVAHRTLPCGTKVTFRYGNRSVTATVDDRGPFTGGRDWDLDQNTAAALGFGGVDTVWSSQ